MIRRCATAFVLLLTTGPLLAGLDLRLPTENQHLFSGQPERFYMHVDRVFEGTASKPWEGGSFGLVRNAVRVDGKVLMTKFHEGIDIAPIQRDRAGNALDLVSSIADGRVVHVSPVAGRSNYGKYLVVEHQWENSPVYSLYAHLAEITCKPGDPVKAGSVLGRMGCTGAGINRVRSHLHLEVALLMSQRFDDWNKANAGGINHHGVFNGMNLAGCDPAALFLAHRDNPELRFSEFIAATPVHFKVRAPVTAAADFVARYPWLLKGDATGAKSWEISFSATGLPVAVAPSTEEVTVPQVTSIRPADAPQSYITRSLVTGSGNRVTLTTGGRRLVSLLTGGFPAQVSGSRAAPQ